MDKRGMELKQRTDIFLLVRYCPDRNYRNVKSNKS